MFENLTWARSHLLRWVPATLLLVGAIGTIVLIGNSSAEGESRTDRVNEWGFSILKPVDGEGADLPETAKLLLALSESDKSAVEGIGETTTSARSSVIVVGQDGRICILESRRGLGNCGDAKSVTAGDLYVASPVSCSRVRVIGLVPDGVEQIDIQQHGHAGEPIEVRDNVYDVVLPAERTSVASGGNDIGFTIPLDSFAEMGGGCP